MINNRQNGRRRGRGGGPRTPNNAPNSGNRQDNRSRGNAAQLHEKYKSLARDAQLAGDRVQTEYYLQFADHYFRILNENRARFEEQRPRRDDYYGDEDDQDEAVNAGEQDDGEEGEREPRFERQPREQRFNREPRGDRDGRGDREPREARAEREPRGDRQDRFERQPRAELNGDVAAHAEAPANVAADGEAAEAAPRPRRGRPRRDRSEEANGAGEERISLDVLPPSIGLPADPVPGVEGEPVKPARRRAVRRPRSENDDTPEVAPAA